MKKIISIFLSFTLVFTSVFSANLTSVNAATKTGKVKITYYNLDIVDGVVLKWNKVKKADGYLIYRGKWGSLKATTLVKTIKNKKKLKYVSGIYHKKKNKKGFAYKKHDPYQVKAFKYVKKNGKKVKKVIAKSDVLYMYTTFGENGSVPGYINIAQQAVDTTKKVITTLGVDKWGGMGKGLSSFVTNLSKGLSAVNTVLGFLGFGSSKDQGPTVEELMYEEIQDMHVELDHINSVVEKMSDELSQFRAESKYADKLRKAFDLNAQWNDFEQKYMENGMEELLQTYEFKVREGIKAWWKGTRTDDETFIDNTSITVKYEPTTNDLIYGRQNGITDDEKDYAYIKLNEKSLPTAGSYFDMDEYQDDLKSAITNGIKAGIVLDDSSEYFETANMPVFTKEGWAAATESERNEAITKVCEDAHDVLIYRIGYIVINQNPEMVRSVISTFKNYCVNLNKGEYGIDALTGAMRASSAFAGEIREQYNSFCATMIVKTGEYASFAIDVIGKSNITKKSETDPGSDINVAADNWLWAVEVIQSYAEGLSTYDDYCFVTNCRLDVLPVTAEMFYNQNSKFEGNDVVPLKKRFKGKEIELTNCDNKDCYSENIGENMITSDQAQLINMLFLGKSHDGTYSDFLRDVCEVKDDITLDHSHYVYNEHGQLVYVEELEKIRFDKCLTSLDFSFSNLTDSDYALPVYARVYAFHPKISKFEDIRKEKILYQKRMTGSYIDTASGVISNNAVLLAVMGTYKDDSWNKCDANYPVDAYTDMHYHDNNTYTIGFGTKGTFVFVKVK